MKDGQLPLRGSAGDGPAGSGGSWSRHLRRSPWLHVPAALAVAFAACWLALPAQRAPFADPAFLHGRTASRDLQRDSRAAWLQLRVQMHYDAAAGRMSGTIYNLGQGGSDEYRLQPIPPAEPGEIAPDPAATRLSVSGDNRRRARTEKLFIILIHPSSPARDIRLVAAVDRRGGFSVALPALEAARWQVLIEDELRDWRLRGRWQWPQQPSVDIKAGTASPR